MTALETPMIQKTSGICGGDARVRDSRIPVWLLVLQRKSGRSDAEVLRSYPKLTQADLDAAWGYYRDNPLEVEQSIWLSDMAANVSDGAPVSAAVIVAGRLLRLDDAAIREAFDPPLTHGAIAAAWAEDRTEGRTNRCQRSLNRR